MIPRSFSMPDGRMVPKAYRDQVVVKPREDLDQCLMSDTIILPDVAQTASPSPTIDHTAICEVIDIGPGSLDDPDLPEVKRGDVVAFDLFGVSQAFMVDGEGYLIMPFRAVRALIHNPGDKETERVQPLNDWVLSVPDLAAMRRHFIGNLHAPDGILDEGHSGDGYDSIVRCVLDRVVGVGKGIQTKLGLYDPGEQIKAGDLVGFSPTESCSFRRFGQKYRLTPAENLLFHVEAAHAD